MVSFKAVRLFNKIHRIIFNWTIYAFPLLRVIHKIEVLESNVEANTPSSDGKHGKREMWWMCIYV